MPRIEDGIIIRDPKTNSDIHRRFTSASPLPGLEIEEYGFEERRLSKVITEGTISPERFPLAVDLFAGDGSWARRLIDRGWAAENITCIDIAKTETPLVDGVNWLYLDLAVLARVTDRGHLYGQVDQLRGRFDLAFMSYGALSAYRALGTADNLCGFFIRKGGIAYAEGVFKFKGRKDMLIPLRQT